MEWKGGRGRHSRVPIWRGRLKQTSLPPKRRPPITPHTNSRVCCGPSSSALGDGLQPNMRAWKMTNRRWVSRSSDINWDGGGAGNVEWTACVRSGTTLRFHIVPRSSDWKLCPKPNVNSKKKFCLPSWNTGDNFVSFFTCVKIHLAKHFLA